MMTSSPRDEINGRLLKHQKFYKYLYKTKIRGNSYWWRQTACGVKDIEDIFIEKCEAQSIF